MDTVLLSDRKRLLKVLLLTSGYFLAELVAGFYTNSLALISDSVHVLTDVVATALALFSLWVASRPATENKTYGYVRAEILGALFNGLLLLLIGIFIFYKAFERLRQPPHDVLAGGVMAVAVIGLAMNLFLAYLTRAIKGQSRSLAIRAVFLHVLFDMVGSLGVLISGATIYMTGWTRADPLVSFLIGSLIIYGSWGLIREGVNILMEAVPAQINLEELKCDLLAVPGTEELHDLHVWCLTQRELALSAHAVVNESADPDRVLVEMSRVLEDKFNIRHITLQIERRSCMAHAPYH